MKIYRVKDSVLYDFAFGLYVSFLFTHILAVYDLNLFSYIIMCYK